MASTDIRQSMFDPLNVLGTPLKTCSTSPRTGWFRDGCCNTDASDRGSHTVAAQVNEAFLAHLADHGNDLVTPVPEHGFPGLKEGDRWCVCAGSWYEAYKKGQACPVVLEATHAAALHRVPLDALLAHAVGLPSA
ncbi:MAG: hypothetical protein ACI8PZ_000921 [Myxococcota bacterium]|jgi:uncharacterized protein (DUF2237 family)